MSELSHAHSSSLNGAAILRSAFVLVWLLSAPVLCVLYLKIEPSPDQAQFDYMAWMATQGLPYYAGSFDMNWPGAMLLHEAAIRLFGRAAWSWHLLDFALMQMAAIAAALFMWRAGFRVAPWIVLVLYPPLYVTAGGWMAGQRDIVAMNLLLIACCAMLDPATHERRSLFCTGVLVAAAVLIRPTYLSVFAGLLILETLPQSWVAHPRRHSVVVRLAALSTGFCLVIFAIVIWAMSVGNLDDWYQQSVLFTSQVYFGNSSFDMFQTLVVLFTQWWHWLSLGSLIGLALWIRRDRAIHYPLLMILGLACAILLSFFVQRKGFGYHIAGFVPLLTMLTAAAIEQLFAIGRRGHGALQKLSGAAFIGLVSLAIMGTGAKLSSNAHLLKDYWEAGISPVAGGYDIPAADQAKMIEIIRADSTPEDRMVQYGTAYHVPYLAQRLPPHRFITPAIELMTSNFALFESWMAEIQYGLSRHRPKFVLITGAPFTQTVAGLAPVDQDSPVLSALLSYMGDSYEVRLQGEYGTLFRRKGQ